MGNQGHTTNGIRLIKEWYDQEFWVKLERFTLGMVFSNLPLNYFTKPETFPPSVDPVPSYLDWDSGLVLPSTNPLTAYAPKSWRGFYDFGNGQLGDWACHTIDGPFWALQLGCLIPQKVCSKPRTEHGFIAGLIRYQIRVRCQG